MAERWVRCTLTAELLSDAHFGSGSGGGSVDALIARDRRERPVVWASHIEGVLRDAARRLRGDSDASNFFGSAGGHRQCAIFTSLYADADPGSHIWRSAARQAFDNRVPKNETLRVIEYVPRSTKFKGQVELPESELSKLNRLVQEVDALGSGRATGTGRVKLTLAESPVEARAKGEATERLVLLLKNIDPLCITKTATPDNLIPSLAFVPGRAVLGAIVAWLIAEDNHDEAARLLVGGQISVSDALPVPHAPPNLITAEVLPAPLSLKSEKPRGSAGDVPWWAQPKTAIQRFDAEKDKKDLKRPEDDLFVYRAAPSEPWTTFQPARRVRLRNGRPNPKQPDASLFAIEQIAEETHFLCELCGSRKDMDCLATKLAPILAGQRWLRVGRAGAPVEVVELAWCGDPLPAKVGTTARLTLTSDLLVRDKHLRWRTALDEKAFDEAAHQGLLAWPADVKVGKIDHQDSVMVHGFNGTSRLWRMPAAAIRRGSVFEVSGAGVATLAQMAARGQWLGERIHEGFGRFRIDDALPGVTTDNSEIPSGSVIVDDADEEAAATTKKWFEKHETLAKPAKSGDEERKPSLSQWFDLVADLSVVVRKPSMSASTQQRRAARAGSTKTRKRCCRSCIR